MIQKAQMKKIFFLFFLLFFVLFFLFYFRIEKVNVTGCYYYTEEQIKEKVLSGRLEYNSLFLYVKHRYFNTGEIPFVQKVTVERDSNHEITIRVYEKSLVACIGYMNQYVYFDKDGIVLESSAEKMEEIPYITGIHFKGFTLYEKLKVDDEGIFDRILDLSQLLRRYEIIVDKIKFNYKGEVTLVSSNISVLLGEKEFYDEQIAALSTILPKAREQKLTGVLDMKNYQVGDDVIFRKGDTK